MKILEWVHCGYEFDPNTNMIDTNRPLYRCCYCLRYRNCAGFGPHEKTCQLKNALDEYNEKVKGIHHQYTFQHNLMMQDPLMGGDMPQLDNANAAPTNNHNHNHNHTPSSNVPIPNSISNLSLTMTGGIPNLPHSLVQQVQHQYFMTSNGGQPFANDSAVGMNATTNTNHIIHHHDPDLNMRRVANSNQNANNGNSNSNNSSNTNLRSTSNSSNDSGHEHHTTHHQTAEANMILANSAAASYGLFVFFFFLHITYNLLINIRIFFWKTHKNKTNQIFLNKDKDKDSDKEKEKEKGREKEEKEKEKGKDNHREKQDNMIQNEPNPRHESPLKWQQLIDRVDSVSKQRSECGWAAFDEYKNLVGYFDNHAKLISLDEINALPQTSDKTIASFIEPAKCNSLEFEDLLFRNESGAFLDVTLMFVVGIYTHICIFFPPNFLPFFVPVS
ncbi:PHD zinc finger-containing protein [Reticulomyxa filosa]|uniref:PHD zinc finger-containing protein n=1 Tax=Reticulomyxa filosa TaxID=46433 RepID=X6MPR5_RETFI|nr:PHD zinc finger-containing protein [Reticulomyxa filosa]|eukprot:ETO15988.1 PHD zinc finger-containing protein [Reticulomyxa filosa]